MTSRAAKKARTLKRFAPVVGHVESGGVHCRDVDKTHPWRRFVMMARKADVVTLTRDGVWWIHDSRMLGK